MSGGHPAVAPHGRYHIGPYTFTRYTVEQMSRWPWGGHRWGCQAHGKGVDFFRTPLGALRGLRRWLKEPNGLVPVGDGHHDTDNPTTGTEPTTDAIGPESSGQ